MNCQDKDVCEMCARVTGDVEPTGFPWLIPDQALCHECAMQEADRYETYLIECQRCHLDYHKDLTGSKDQKPHKTLCPQCSQTILPVLFSRKLKERTYYRNLEDVQSDQVISMDTRAFILQLLKDPNVEQVVVIPRKALSSVIDND